MENFFSKKIFNTNRSNEKLPEKILPSDIRYALQYKEGLLNKSDLEILAMSNFENEAAYLALKNLRNEPEKHKILFEKYIGFIQNHLDDTPENKKIIQDIIVDGINSSDNEDINGVKLAQISRQGFSNWKEKFTTMAVQMSQSEKNIFLLAHATLLGIKPFVVSFKEKKKDLNVIVPSWVAKHEEHAGYKLNFSQKDFSIDWLGKDFNKENAVLIDDSINTGDTIKQINEFWSEESGIEPEFKAIVTKETI